MTASREAKVYLGAAAVVVVGVGLLDLAVPWAHRWLDVRVSNVGWTASGLLATLAAAFAARNSRDADSRRVWRLLAMGCGAWLLGQLVWDFYTLSAGRDPPFPSLADAGFLALYGFAFAAVAALYRRQGLPATRETALDVILLTLAVGVVGYFELLAPMFRGRLGTFLEVAVSLAWQLSGVGLLWALAMLLLHLGVGFAGRALPALLAGLAIHAVSNFAYAAIQVGGAYQTGHAVDYGWTLGLCLVAASAALEVLDGPMAAPTPAPPRARAAGAAVRHTMWTRVVPTAMGGIAFAVVGAGAVARGGFGRTNAALLVGLFAAWAVLVMVRFGQALAADRRYAERLEEEVARQTMSLMDSLSATAAAERQLRQLMEAVPDAILAVDRDGRILELNQASASMMATVSAAGGRTLWDFLQVENQLMVRENLEAAFRGETRRFEIPFLREDGSRGVSAVVYSPVRDVRERGGVVTRVLALARDVTDQRRMEHQLAQADKLAALGQLVSGVAHEINNPAATISGFAQSLLTEGTASQEHSDILRMIHEEAVRIGRITRNLLAFARATRAERVLVDLNEVVRRTFALRAYHFTTLNIHTTLELDDDPPTFWGDVSQIQQVLLNLLINAEHALQQVPPPPAGERALLVRTAKADGHATLAVTDTGPGVPADLQRRIFDPFFTTKPEGEGTGLGLSIAYGIVHNHGGRIWVESPGPLGRGAVFHLRLPLEQRRETRPPRVSAPAAGRRVFSLLVVDDEQGWRNALLRYLTRRGHHGIGAPDPDSALQMLGREDFDVLLVDAHLPGLSAPDFVEAVRAVRAECHRRVIFVTADTAPASVQQVVAAERLRTVAKPVDFEDLERLVGALLAE